MRLPFRHCLRALPAVILPTALPAVTQTPGALQIPGYSISITPGESPRLTIARDGEKATRFSLHRRSMAARH